MERLKSKLFLVSFDVIMLTRSSARDTRNWKCYEIRESANNDLYTVLRKSSSKTEKVHKVLFDFELQIAKKLYANIFEEIQISLG